MGLREQNKPRSRPYYAWGIGIFFIVHFGYLLFLQTRSDITQNTTLRVISDVLVLIGSLGGAAACGFALWKLLQLQKQSTDVMVTRSWIAVGCLCVAAVGYSIGQGIWTWNEATFSFPPFPSIGDFFYLIVYLFEWAALALLTPRRSTIAGRTRLLLDAGIAVASMMAVSWYFVLGPTITNLSGTPLAKFVGLAYPLGDLSLAIIAAFLLFGSSNNTSALSATIARVAIGFTLLPITSVFYTSAQLSGVYHTGYLSDVGWPLGWLFIGWAALSYPQALVSLANQRRTLDAPSGSTRLKATGAALRAIAPALIALFTCGLLLFAVALRNTAPLIQVVFVCAGLFLLPIIRQALTLIDNLMLNERLRVALDKSQQAFQNSQRELISTTTRAEQYEELRAGIENLQSVHAQISRGDLSARAQVQGPLAPVAQSLNLLIERMGRWSQQQQQIRMMEQEAEQIYRALESLSESGSFANPQSSPSPLPTGRALFAASRLQNRLQVRFRRLRETSDLLASRLTTLAEMVARERQVAHSSPQVGQLLTQIEKSIGHSRDVLKDLQAQAVGYAQEANAEQPMGTRTIGISRPDYRR